MHLTIPRLLVLAAITCAVSFLLPGCGGGTPPKTEDPAEIEKIRTQHVKESQRERENK